MRHRPSIPCHPYQATDKLLLHRKARMLLLPRPPGLGCCRAYFCTILSTFIYTAVPMVSLVWGVHPVTLNRQFALAATIYFGAGGTDLDVDPLTR